jgi:hypothetical protein
MNENETVTFLPHDDVKETSPATLSTTGRLISYNDQLKASLKKGFKFTELLDQLISTNSTEKLLSAVAALTAYQLDSAFLTFPQQYSRSDFYLIFLNRLLELHQHSGMILQSSDRFQELYHEYPGINTKGYFVFQISDLKSKGAYYVEKNKQQQLFYLSFDQHLLRFNNEALTQLLLVDYYSDIDHAKIKAFAGYLWLIGRYLKEDFGFDVDFGVLDPANNSTYQIIKPDLPKEVIDRLFIATAKSGRMLEAGAEQSAVLQLDKQVVLRLFCQADPQRKNFGKWQISIFDPQQQVSLFDVLLKYDFIRDWYLNDLATLAVESDPLYFS